MREVRTLSLKFWLPLLVSTTFVLLWAFMLLHEFKGLESDLIKSNIESVRHDVTALQREIEKEVRKNDPFAAQQAVSLRGLNTHYQTLAAIDAQTNIIYSTQLAHIGSPVIQTSPNFDVERFKLVVDKNLPEIQYNPDNYLISGYVPLRISLEEKQIRSFSAGAIYFAYDISLEHSEIWQRMVSTVISSGMGLLLVLLLLIAFLDYFVTRPIQHLVNSAKAIARPNDEVRSNILGRGEIASLGKAFNEMAEQLKSRFEQSEAAEKALRESENQKVDLLNNTSAVIYIKDCEGRYLFVNSVFESLFVISNEEIQGKTDFDLFPEELAKVFRKNDIAAAKLTHPVEREEVVPHKGRALTYLSIKFSLKNEDNEVYATCGISTDITERKLAEEKFIHQAHYDTLTNLPNRVLALDRLSQMINEAKRDKSLFAVLFIDLDDFKKVNDSLGHEVGDSLLITAGKRLKSTIREVDTVARLGGDEFIIFLGHLKSANDAIPTIESILTQLKRPFSIDNRELVITASVGVAMYPDDGVSTSELLRKADSAMYNAKAVGRNTFSFFTESMNQQVSRRLELEEYLHSAIQRDEFEVVYQPKINIADGEIVGAEALLRWHCEALGEVSPDEFIPVAEQSGLIDKLGEFVLCEALTALAEWQNLNRTKIQMAVNLSPVQFRDPDLVKFIKTALEEREIDGEDLELEITEGVLLSGHSFITKALKELDALGIFLAMDDFGTGYSSISYLRSYSFDTLKIDRHFINDITEDNEVLELVNATIVMAHALKIIVVAEGVETKEQYACLKNLGCDFVQGYYFSRPVSKSDFLAYTVNKDKLESSENA
ncbi:MAG: diguanylate cyclase (GGDEF)-like protein/PAS domain S-box-containing protein [Glaciecola sp.]|jgi:diguanylate cyclase (GGDEF)-like protein/PAS domain S-box-containing protein